jgi:hypothetical protein
MRFYNEQHAFYCGVDLHTKRMYLCILDHEGNKLLHRNVRANPLRFLQFAS